MKPEHFKKVNPEKVCETCANAVWIEDQDAAVCTHHRFTLPKDNHNYRCDDFKKINKKEDIVEILDLTTASITTNNKIVPFTLNIKEAWICSSNLTTVKPNFCDSISGSISGSKNGLQFEFTFKAIEIVVEK